MSELTDERARELAYRWAAWHEYDAAQGSIVPRPSTPAAARLSASERRDLFVLVRREMRREVRTRRFLREYDECQNEDHGYLGGVDGDREALAHHIATKLGGPFVCEECEGLGYLTMSPQGERYGCPECQSGRDADVDLARELCEAACPSGQPAAT